MRISNIVRTADWIKTEYLNQSAPGTYVTFGSQQNPQSATAQSSWYSSNWTNRRLITIDHTKVSTASGTTLTNFPMLFSTTDTEFKITGNGGKVASSSGADILFTDSDGLTKLNYEREFYSSSTGQLIAWVQIQLCLRPLTIKYIFTTATTPEALLTSKIKQRFGTLIIKAFGIWATTRLILM